MSAYLNLNPTFCILYDLGQISETLKASGLLSENWRVILLIRGIRNHLIP